MINEFFEGIANTIIRKPKLMAGLVLVFYASVSTV